MKWTGHSDSQAMKSYIEIAEKTKADAMKIFEQAMEKLLQPAICLIPLFICLISSNLMQINVK